MFSVVCGVGCGSVSASRLSPTIFAGCQYDDCSTLKVDVTFPDDHGSPVDGDQLVYKFRDVTIHPKVDGNDYPGFFAIDTPPMKDEVVTVILHLDTTVEVDLTMPSRFENLELPLFASRASDLVIAWSDATPTDQVGWASADPVCVGGLPAPPVSDTGSLTIPANTFQLSETNKELGHATCTTSIALGVIRNFDPDPVFESSMVEALLRKQVTFASMP
jgi:hypothetical protein